MALMDQLAEKEEKGEELTQSQSQLLHPDSQNPITPSPVHRMLSFSTSPHALPDTDAESTDAEHEGPEEESETDDEILEPVKGHDREIYVIPDDDEKDGDDTPPPPKDAPEGGAPPPAESPREAEPAALVSGKGVTEEQEKEESDVFNNVQELLNSEEEKEKPVATRGTFQDWITFILVLFWPSRVLGFASLGLQAADSPS